MPRVVTRGICDFCSVSWRFSSPAKLEKCRCQYCGGFLKSDTMRRHSGKKIQKSYKIENYIVGMKEAEA